MKAILFALIFSLSAIIPMNLVAQRKISENHAKFLNGDVISSSNGTIKKSNLFKSRKPYDELIYGVYFSISDSLPSKFYKMQFRKEGIFEVKYNNENGTIKKGDYVTSSSTQGVAMKATQPGMILGVALEDATNSNGLVKIRILIQYLK